ncbi:solute carrier family 25 [Nesidiocoris tenuis]|uniref:Solute carrier family 25 n=1 Tax=Nesidiocoris tenuis TaxID=355587 RepID=A0ABN7AYY0_9HEMI|nr:solute carrier family 25 [Nesidiocoris tenuis]
MSDGRGKVSHARCRREDESTKCTGRVAAHFMAGLTAGVVSRTITAPLDRLKVISQIKGKTIFPIQGIRMMLAEGGFWSMWRGNGANIMKVGPEIAAKFLVYNEAKNALVGHNQESTTVHKLIAGFTAGAISHSIVHPLEVCKTRLVLRKTGEEGGLRNTARKGYRKHGWRFFFKGYKMSVMGIALFSTLDFAVYETLKKLWCSAAVNSRVCGVIACGVCSSLCGIVVCFPFGVLGVNLQMCDELKNTSDVIKFVRRRRFIGLYRGVTTAVIKGVPTFTLSYLTYEHIIKYLGHKMI